NGDQQRDRPRQLRPQRRGIQTEFQVVPGFVDGQQQGAAPERQQVRCDHQVRDPRQPPWSCSLPSTWSEPVIARAPIINTRYSAVVAKPMTMAVSTSAWGKGSA